MLVDTVVNRDSGVSATSFRNPGNGQIVTYVICGVGHAGHARRLIRSSKFHRLHTSQYSKDEHNRHAMVHLEDKCRISTS